MYVCICICICMCVCIYIYIYIHTHIGGTIKGKLDNLHSSHRRAPSFCCYAAILSAPVSPAAGAHGFVLLSERRPSCREKKNTKIHLSPGHVSTHIQHIHHTQHIQTRKNTSTTSHTRVASPPTDPTPARACAAGDAAHDTNRHRLSGYSAQRVPGLFLASSFRKCFDCEVLKGMFPWRTRYPLSLVPIKPVPNTRFPGFLAPSIGLKFSDVPNGALILEGAKGVPRNGGRK